MLGRNGGDPHRIDAFKGDSRHPELVRALRFQRDTLEDIREEADGLIPVVLIPDLDTGELISRREFFNRHARLLHILCEKNQLGSLQ